MKEKINLRNPAILEHGGLNGKGFKNKCATKSSIASSGNEFENRCAHTQRFASLQMERKRRLLTLYEIHVSELP